MQHRDGSPGTSCNLEKRNADHMYITITMMKGGGMVGVRLGDCYPICIWPPSGIKLLDLSFGSFATCFCFFLSIVLGRRFFKALISYDCFTDQKEVEEERIETDG